MIGLDDELTDVRALLLGWFGTHRRPMPWRESRDPYHIWLSEVMLQQTRVDQAMPYYRRFVDAFPAVGDLAAADLHDVLLLWEGLGYYSRGRNLHKAAKVVDEQYGGRFPESYAELLSLPGVGPYTAAAVASIAFGKAHAVVDGNVIRVLSRFAGIEEDVRSQTTIASIQRIADTLLDPDRPGDFNQAMMELGSLVCTPTRPDCSNCPLATRCVAYTTARTQSIPYKTPKPKVPLVHVVVAVISDTNGQLLVARRPDNVMLGGLWEFPGGKVDPDETHEQALHREIREELGVTVTIRSPFMQIKHAYSHFKVHLHAYLCNLVGGEPVPRASSEIRWVYPEQLAELPFPKANRTLTQKIMEMSRDAQP